MLFPVLALVAFFGHFIFGIEKIEKKKKNGYPTKKVGRFCFYLGSEPEKFNTKRYSANCFLYY